MKGRFRCMDQALGANLDGLQYPWAGSCGFHDGVFFWFDRGSGMSV